MGISLVYSDKMQYDIVEFNCKNNYIELTCITKYVNFTKIPNSIYFSNIFTHDVNIDLLIFYRMYMRKDFNW